MHYYCNREYYTERKPYRRLSRRRIQKEIDLIAQKVGLPDKVSPHVLRHTFTTTLTLNNGAELFEIIRALKESSPDTIFRYAKITHERKREKHKKYLIQ